MLQRKIIDRLIEWKNKPNHMSLLIEGARQVGKTFAVREFAEANYSQFIELNFEEHPSYRDIFDGDLDVDTIISQISLVVPNARFVPGETLLFFDEIQSAPQARTSLKFFSLDGRFDVIASGSLLGLGYREVSSFPVGHVERIRMHSLDFEEFLWARGIAADALAPVRDAMNTLTPVPTAVHERLMALFREYIVVGGMPRAVQQFTDTRNFGEVLEIQRGIIADYLDDIAKYARETEKAKARAAFLSIPQQLARDYKKFSYAVLDKHGSARKYGGSLQWLLDAGIITYCHNTELPALPLEGNARTDTFKVYMADTGLLVSMLEDGSQKDIIDGNLGIYKGALYENIIGDVFTKAGKKLYYFEKNSKIEMDFLIRETVADHSVVTAVEVKSSENRKAKSMDSLFENYGVTSGIKLSSGNVGCGREGVRILPLYMAMWL